MSEMGSFKLAGFSEEETVMRFVIILFWPQSIFTYRDECMGPSVFPSGTYEVTKSQKPSVIKY